MTRSGSAGTSTVSMTSGSGSCSSADAALCWPETSGPRPRRGRFFGHMGRHCDGAPLALVADVDRPGRSHFGHGEVGRHQLHPPLHDAVGFGEEAMAADVHPVALVPNGARDAADLLASFEQHGHDIGAPEKLEASRQASRTGPDDDRFLCQSNSCVLFSVQPSYPKQTVLDAGGR